MAVSSVFTGLKAFIFQVKRDRAAREALVLVAVVMASALLIGLVGNRFLLAGLQRRHRDLKLECDRLQRELAQPLPIADVKGLMRERDRLKHSLELLETKRFFLSKDHAARTDAVRFQRVVLGFVPGAPFSLKTSLIRSTFTGSRAAVNGRLPYIDLVQYLDYLEHELSVAYMDDLMVKREGCGDKGAGKGLLCFSLTLASAPPGAEKPKRGAKP